ncbi:MAG: hypothetical protein N4J56_002015 [Chroococcidiopsis sp. SAG 2025]|nr:hypothetical protein [Chroococcidiopsis sp. SAG 2025]
MFEPILLKAIILSLLMIAKASNIKILKIMTLLQSGVDAKLLKRKID